MDLTTVINISARIEQAYTTIQNWIRNDAPVLEQRLKKAALLTAEMLLEFSLVIINWASAQLDKADEYRLIIALAYINSKRFAVRQAIEIISFYEYCKIILSLSLDTAHRFLSCKSTQFEQFNQRYHLTATTRKLWTRKGAIATAALDKVFALN
jgi:hypothetical protein